MLWSKVKSIACVAATVLALSAGAIGLYQAGAAVVTPDAPSVAAAAEGSGVRGQATPNVADAPVGPSQEGSPASARSHGPVAAFTAPPSARRDGQQVRISFAVNTNTDVAVYIWMRRATWCAIWRPAC